MRERRRLTAYAIPLESSYPPATRSGASPPPQCRYLQSSRHRVRNATGGVGRPAASVEATLDGEAVQSQTLSQVGGVGWILVDVLGGFVPLIVDAATSSWNQLDTTTVRCSLEQAEMEVFGARAGSEAWRDGPRAPNSPLRSMVRSRWLVSMARAILVERMPTLLLTVLVAAAPLAERPRIQTDVDELFAVVLDRVLTVKDYLQSRHFLPEKAPIPIDETIGNTEFRITRQALKDPSRWSIRSRRQLQEQADASGKVVYYVTVSNLTMNGSSAALQIGVTLVAPSPDHKSYLVVCCCGGEDRYERSQGHGWRFKRRVGTLCS